MLQGLGPNFSAEGGRTGVVCLSSGGVVQGLSAELSVCLSYDLSGGLVICAVVLETVYCDE